MSSVYTEYFVIDDGCESQIVKDVGAVPPHIDGSILPQAFVVEAIHLSNLPALVISSDKRNSFGVPNLEGQQKQESLHGVVAAIDEVSHEEVIGVGALATHFKELFQVIELPMNISADLIGINE